MDFLSNDLYREDLCLVANSRIDWSSFENSVVMISGASGMIGSFLTDVLMLRNRTHGMRCKVIALGRNTKRARQRFATYWEDPFFRFYSCDVTDTICVQEEIIDYIIHAASNTHPIAYATDPIGSITTNIIGTRNLLECAVEKGTKRFVFLSSVEVYGENRGDQEAFEETYCGYIDCNTLRAGYPEGKRAGEALCQAYIRQKGLDVVIPRLARIYGPTLLESDSKAMSQFLRKGVAHENIVLKSDGSQYFSYCYVADAVNAILFCLQQGKCGHAYNVSDLSSDITLRDLAGLVAKMSGMKVIFDIPDKVESAGYSKATVAIMSGQKLKNLGWDAFYSIEQGVARTLAILNHRSGIRNGNEDQ